MWTSDPNSSEPERRVWDWLAAHDVPFGEPVPDLVARFGTDADQPSGEPLCRLASARPLVPDQLVPLAFHPLREPGPPAPPHHLQTTVYDGRDARASFDAASRRLTEALGRGLNGKASNVLSRIWTRGLAEVRLTWWPSERNAEFTYAYPDPLRSLASQLDVEPGAVPSLSAAEAEALAAAQRLSGVRASFWAANRAYAAHRRRPPEGVGPGVYVGAETAFVLAGRPDRDRLVAVPRVDVEAVTWVDVAPARFSGSSAVVLGVAGGARVEVATGAFGALRGVAEALAAWAGAPLDTERGLDD